MPAPLFVMLKAPPTAFSKSSIVTPEVVSVVFAVSVTVLGVVSPVELNVIVPVLEVAPIVTVPPARIRLFCSV